MQRSKAKGKAKWRGMKRREKEVYREGETWKERELYGEIRERNI